MTVSLFANPGQTVTLAVQVLDGYGERADGYSAPVVDFIQLPNGSMSDLYPENTTSVAEGVFKHSFTIPFGISAVGTYLASISWQDPDTGAPKYELFLIHVALPFGASTVSPV